jgi:zinc transport system substrate-binding protein
MIGLAALVAVTGCGGPNDRQADGRLPVAVSVPPQAWLVRQIGGEHVDVVSIVQPGSSPATYQPSDAEVSRIMASAVYFRVGVPFENGPWFHAIQAARRLEIVDTRGDIRLRDIEAHRHDEHDETGEHDGKDDHDDGHHGERANEPNHAHDHGPENGKDPHIWLSPRLLEKQAEIMAEALAAAAPQHADEFADNLAALRSRLQAVDAQVREKLEPFEGRAFFVFHPAWGYFADEYGLKQMAIEVEGKEPSDGELTRLQQQARDSGASVIFVQPQISSQSAAAVAAAIGGRVERLDPLAENVAEGLVAVADAIAASLSANPKTSP